jgi:hypothetical protein
MQLRSRASHDTEKCYTWDELCSKSVSINDLQPTGDTNLCTCVLSRTSHRAPGRPVLSLTSQICFRHGDTGLGAKKNANTDSPWRSHSMPPKPSGRGFSCLLPPPVSGTAIYDCTSSWWLRGCAAFVSRRTRRWHAHIHSIAETLEQRPHASRPAGPAPLTRRPCSPWPAAPRATRTAPAVARSPGR